MSQVSPPVAAAAAGLTEAELAAFEETGRCAQKINFTALAKILGLHPQKLEAIANGWLPVATDLRRWRGLRAFSTTGEGLTVNCFLVWDEATRAAALFDTGLDAAPVVAAIAAEGLILQHVFITHAHWDHVEALPEIRTAFPTAQLHSSSKNALAKQRNQSGETISLGGLRITHRETPGHAEDGVTYFIGGWLDAVPPVAVVGDAIFAGSIGRGNQSWDLAREKVRKEILSLPMATLLCPGHGPVTTVAEEKEHNPFF